MKEFFTAILTDLFRKDGLIAFMFTPIITLFKLLTFQKVTDNPGYIEILIGIFLWGSFFLMFRYILNF
jgi:type IV secretory pathway TrbL component